MNGNKAVLDSNVIIDASKGLISINEIVNNFDYLFISIISYVEVLGYNFSNKKEKKVIENILNNIPIINLDIEIAEKAIAFRIKSKIKIPDAIILATAKSKKAALITRNVIDFNKVDDSITIIEPKLRI